MKHYPGGKFIGKIISIIMLVKKLNGKIIFESEHAGRG